jgi:hypothetical protein
MLDLVLGLAALTVVCKGVGPALSRVPEWLTRRTSGLAPALLAALVATEVRDGGVKAVAVGIAAVPIVLGAPPLVSVVLGAGAAALLRAL